MTFIDRCREFISIDSSPQAGTLEAGLWLRHLAESFEMEVDFQTENYQGQNQANIFIRQGARRDKEFLLQSHYDTVNPGAPSLWVNNLLNPFHAVIKDGKIFGLGACEPKIDLLCKLEALRSFSKVSPWRLSPVIAATYGGEIGMQGLLRAIRKNRFSAKTALVGEPSGSQLIYAGQGYAIIDFVIPFSEEENRYRNEHNFQESVSTQTKIFKGKYLHSADSSLSENAIQKAFEYLLQIPDGVVLMDIEGGLNHNTVADNVVLEFDLCGGVHDPMVSKLRRLFQGLQQISTEFMILEDKEFSSPHPTMNFGVIQTHEGYIQLVVSCRFPPIVGEEHYQTWLGHLEKASTKVGGQCRVVDYKRPYRTDLNSDFVKTCREVLSSIGRPDECISQSACTEMSLLARIGVECLGYGAGLRKDNLTMNREAVTINELETSIRFYRSIIERICL